MKTVYTKSPKKPHSFVEFFYMFFLFICGLFVLTLSFYALSLTSTEKLQNEQLAEKCDSTNLKISLELHDYLYNNLNRSVTSVNIFSGFLKSKDADLSYFQKIRVDLFDHYLLKQDILNDILLYRAYDKAFISATRAGYSLEATYTQTNASVNYADLHELTALEPFLTPSFHITATSHLYYIFPVYQHTQDNPAEYLGFAALFIEPSAFFDTNNTSSSSDDSYGTSLILYDEEVIFAKGENVLSEKAVLSIISEFSSEKNNGSYKSMLNRNFVSTEYSFYYAYSETNNLTFLYYEPVVNPLSLLFNPDNDLTLFYWISIAVLFIFFITAVIIKLKQLHHSYSLHEFNHVTENPDEYYIFKETIDILSGNISPQKLGTALCNVLNIKQPDKYTSCILIEPEPLTILKMTPEQKADFMEEITKSVRMHSDVTTDTHFAVISYPQNKITCLINSNNFLPETLAHNILEHLEGVYNNCRFNVLCSTPSLLISDLQRNYQAITGGLRYSYIYNFGNLFTQEAIERFEASDDTIDPALSTNFRQLLKDHRFDELIKYAEELPSFIREKAPSFSRVYDHYRSIFFIMTSYCNSNYNNYPYKDVPPSDILRQFETIDETSEFLAELLTTLKASAASDDKSQENNISQKFIDRIVEYIDEHIVDVSLNGVAEHFNVSAAHLSRVFKENAGINFSDYVAEKKLQKAVELLLDDNNYNIGDIAKALGYNTPAYFSRKFKERFNLSPAMYRKQYMTNTK